MKIAIPTYGGHRRPTHKRLKVLWGGRIARHCGEFIYIHLVINQPLLAAALTKALELSGRIGESMLVGTNFGIGAIVEDNLVIKAPDWFYVRSVLATNPPNQTRRYTPNLQGEVTAIVMEFLSETEGGEYSIKSKYPPGKWYYYDRILQVPNYAIFEPDAGTLELYQLDDGGRYQLQQPDANNRYWVSQMGLYLGIGQGSKANRTRWLRWWDETGQMLLWGTELVEQERLRAERLAAQLRAAGIDPEV